MTWLDDIAIASRPKIEKKPWMHDVTMELVSKDTLTRVIDECIASDYYALDLETTGLDSRVFNGETKDKIVGVCLAPTDDIGYYIPLRHEEGINVPWTQFIREFTRLMDCDARAVFHNAKFDCEFLEFNGTKPLGDWDNARKWEDTLILAYLRNTRERMKGLKFLAKRDLECEMIDLHELFPPTTGRAKKNLNFSLLDCEWEPCLWYAASDAICTRRLYGVLAPTVLEKGKGRLPPQQGIYFLEKRCVTATRWMERCRIQIDEDKVRELIRLGQRDWWASLVEVYEATNEILERDIRPGWFRLMSKGQKFDFDPENTDTFYMDRVGEARKTAERERLDPGRREKGRFILETLTKTVPSIQNKGKNEPVSFPLIYDILAPEKLGLMLRELGAPGLTLTEKSGQVKTSKDELEKILDKAGDRLAYASKLKKFREIGKVLSTYLYPMILDSAFDGTVRAFFNGLKTDTGRFSCSGSKNPKRDGGCRVAWQQIPNSYDPSKPESMRRIRECVVAKGDRVMVAIDYSGVELRIATNLSGEPKWLEEYFRCAECDHRFDSGDGKTTPPLPPPNCPTCGSDKIGDLHSLTALMLFGDSIKTDKKLFKAKRQIAKATNFLLCYGGSAQAVCKTVGTPIDESERIEATFKEQYQTLQRWWSEQHRMGKHFNTVMTAFGRHYPVPDINMPRTDPVTGRKNGMFISKARRNAVNGPVQGTSADITKLAMGLIHTEVKRKGWLDKVEMVITLHDELVFEVDPSVLKEFLVVVPKIMASNKYITKLNWPVPLAVDVDLGKGWNAPYSYTGILASGEVPSELSTLLGPQTTARLFSPEGAPTFPEDDEKGVATTDSPRIKVGEMDEFTLEVTEEDFTLGFAVRLAEAAHKASSPEGVALKLHCAQGNAKTADAMKKLSSRLPRVTPTIFEKLLSGEKT
jgi:DNA polymerase I-like protein with 3'-5' exonuclease and polymerase domains